MYRLLETVLMDIFMPKWVLKHEIYCNPVEGQHSSTEQAKMACGAEY